MARHVSVEPFPPGEYLQDFMDDKGWTQDDLAKVLGRTRQHINRLLQGKTGITPDTANELASAFDTTAELWMNLQVSHELSLAAKADRDIQRRAQVFEKVPVREIVRRGWLPGADSKNVDSLEAAVCTFLGTMKIEDDVDIPAIAAKKGTPYGIDTAAQIAWYRRAVSLAEHAPASQFAAANVMAGMEELRALAAYPEDARSVPHALSDMGIRLVLLEHLKGTRIDGVAFWLDESTPVIALSLRYDRIDNLWHTMMHELMHIENGDAHPAVDVDMMKDDEKEHERHINELAADALIPKKKLVSFIQRTQPYYYKARVVQFAQANRVHPGIVVGQLQYRDQLKYDQLRKLSPKVRSEILPSAVADGWGNTPSFI